MDAIKQQYPAGQVRELKQLLNRMAVRTANLMKTNQLRFGLAPGP
jgi:transcriptional regulator with GAF, ATPase, and Fis domain